MDEQEKCLNKLIDSSSRVRISSLGGGKVGLDFYRNKDDNVLIRIGCMHKGTDNTYLGDLTVISKGELSLKFFTGCVGEASIDQMMSSFDEYHGESGSDDLSSFLQSLEANKIILCYTSPTGGSRAALVILYNICQKLGIDCRPIIIKPASYHGPRLYRIDVKYFAGYFDTPNYLIYDVDCFVHRLRDIRGPLSMEVINSVVEEEILTIANSMMRC